MGGQEPHSDIGQDGHTAEHPLVAVLHWCPTSVTISKDTAGRYFVSFLLEEDIQTLPVVNLMVGVDVGLKDVAVFSTGEKIANPRHLHKSGHRLAHAQRSLARKKLVSKNREKARWKVARIHANIADQLRWTPMSRQ